MVDEKGDNSSFNIRSYAMASPVFAGAAAGRSPTLLAQAEGKR